jgi:hypothetical protein
MEFLMSIEWKYQHNVISSINDMPVGTEGFIYLITFNDYSRYIGKKDIYSYITLPIKKNGEKREGHIKFLPRTSREYIRKESKWKIYKGSHSECKNKIPISKYILDFGFNKLHLTYLEAKALFKFMVLEKPDFINDNILGKFYRNNLKLTP